MGFDGDCRGMSRGLKMRRRRETEEEEESAACSFFPSSFLFFLIFATSSFCFLYSAVPSFFISFLLVVCEKIANRARRNSC